MLQKEEGEFERVSSGAQRERSPLHSVQGELGDEPAVRESLQDSEDSQHPKLFF